MSVALHVINVVPKLKVPGESFVIESTPIASVAVASPIDTSVETPDASAMMFCGTVIAGAVVSTTVTS